MILAEGIWADICLIGAGPAGLSLAIAMAVAGFRVVLMEAGIVGTAQLLDAVQLQGDDAYPQSHVSQTRANGLGGTSGLWSVRMSTAGNDPEAGDRGCRYAPLDPIDFEARPEVPHSGWPLTRADLDPWYVRAQAACGLGRFDYTSAGWRSPQAQTLPLDPDLIETQMFQFAPAKVWTEAAAATLRAEARVQILTETNATELETDPTGSRVTGVHWRRPDGSTGVVRARATVLAAGGIENSRLLLLSDRQVRGGLGNGKDQVGRYWMEHPLLRGGLLVAPRSVGLGPKLRLYDAHWQGDSKVMAKLSVSADLMRKEGLLSTSAMFMPRDKVLAGRAFQAYTAARSPAGRAASPAVRAGNLAKIATGAVSLLTARTVIAKQPDLDLSGWTALPDAERFRVFEMIHQSEQSPDPQNRIVLSTDIDPLGRRIPVLQWHWSQEDRDRTARSRDIYAEALAAGGFGKVIQKDWEQGRPRMLGGNHHHLGGTRMSTDSATGVVDVDSKVHGVANLFVAGSSVFPGGGSVNPTLTIVALSLRLAAHLKRTLPGLPEQYRPAD